MNVYFSGGRRGDHEAGTWQFWTVGDDADNVTFRVKSDPERRVQDMLNDGLYQTSWTACEKGGLRRATPTEVAAWLLDHPHDISFSEPTIEIFEAFGSIFEARAA